MWSDWDPLAELEGLRRAVERLVESGGLMRGGRRSAFLPGESARGYPRLNLYESPDTLHVEALAPGIDPSTLEVTVTGNILSIAGQKRAVEGVAPEQYHRCERAAGKFVRTVTLPAEVDDARIKAEYADGILTVTLPKSEKAKTKTISVSVR